MPDRIYIEDDINSKQVNFTCEIEETGTPQRISDNASIEFDDTQCLEILISLDSDQDEIAIGGEDVTLATGTLLYPPSVGVTPDAYSDCPKNLNDVWVVGTEGTVIRVAYYPGP